MPCSVIRFWTAASETLDGSIILKTCWKNAIKRCRNSHPKVWGSKSGSSMMICASWRANKAGLYHLSGIATATGSTIVMPTCPFQSIINP